jgi:hypothetical protein
LRRGADGRVQLGHANAGGVVAAAVTGVCPGDGCADPRPWHLEEDRRLQIERQRKIDGKCIRLFSNFAKQLQTVRQMRELLSELGATVPDPTVEIAGRTVADWIIWVEGQIDVRDPARVGTSGVLKDLSAVSEWWKEE